MYREKTLNFSLSPQFKTLASNLERAVSRAEHNIATRTFGDLLAAFSRVLPQIAISRYPTQFCYCMPLPSRPKWTACTAENRPKKGAPGPAAPSRPSEPAAATTPHPSFTVTGCAIASGGAGGAPIPQARGGAATRFRGGRTLPMVCAPPCPITADEPLP